MKPVVSQLRPVIFLLLSSSCWILFHGRSNALMPSSALQQSSTSKMSAMSTKSSTSLREAASRGVSWNHRGAKVTPLPEKLLVGYTTNHCGGLQDMGKVTQAVKDGVNVLIWSFLHFEIEQGIDMEETGRLVLRGGQSDNMSNFWIFKQNLKDMGYSDVVHLVAFGGWNGQHLPSGTPGEELYDAWKQFNTRTQGDDHSRQLFFDGLDWDLEGQDDIDGPRNVFSVECLQQMKVMNQQAKDDGFIVSMAPAESYLDITTPTFSRYLNLTYHEHPEWHADFAYHGRNAYAYLLADGGIDNFDFIQVQFYESYSHAAYHIMEKHMAAQDFLVRYVEHLVKPDHTETTNKERKEQASEACDTKKKSGLFVNFEDEPLLRTRNQFIEIPLSKLVFGFANGWSHNSRGKTVYMSPDNIRQAFQTLFNKQMMPRGCMFWVIEEEGTNNVHFAKELSSIRSMETLDLTMGDE
jgi:chitinase